MTTTAEHHWHATGIVWALADALARDLGSATEWSTDDVARAYAAGAAAAAVTERKQCADICARNSEAKQRIYESTEDDHDRGASLMADWLARAICGRAQRSS